MTRESADMVLLHFIFHFSFRRNAASNNKTVTFKN